MPPLFLATALQRLRPHWPLALLLVAAAGLRAILFMGFLASDDTAYAYDGIAIRSGSFAIGADMTSMRIALNAAAAASFTALGVSEWSIGLPALIASLLTLVVVYSIALTIAGRTAATIAALLYAVSPLNILNSSVLLPEVPMGFFVALAILLFLLALGADSRRRGGTLALAGGIAVGIAYLMKEPAALVVGVFALAGLLSLIRGDRDVWLYALPFCGFAAVFAAETVSYLGSSGELLHRFHVIAQHQAAAVADSEQQRRLQSLWLYPRSMFFVLNQVGLLFYLLVGLSALALTKRWSTPALVMLWLVVPFLYLEFGSTSLTSYNALPKQPRYLEALTAPAVILVGTWTAQWMRSGGPRARQAAYALLGLYVITSPVFAAISFIDRRATVQPISDVKAFLHESNLHPVHATSLIANGLHFWSADPPDLRVFRVCTGCVAGPCTPVTGASLGEVWAAPHPVLASRLPPVNECALWRPHASVPITPPPLHQRAVRVLLSVADRLPLPRAVIKEMEVLRSLLGPRYVTVNVPLEVP